MPCVAAGSPDENHEPAAEVAGGDQAGFAVVPPVIDTRGGLTGEHFGGIGEIEAPLFERDGALHGVEGDPHGFLYPQQFGMSRFRAAGWGVGGGLGLGGFAAGGEVGVDGFGWDGGAGIIEGFTDLGAELGVVGGGVGGEAEGEGAFVGDAGEEDAHGVGDGEAHGIEDGGGAAIHGGARASLDADRPAHSGPDFCVLGDRAVGTRDIDLKCPICST